MARVNASSNRRSGAICCCAMADPAVSATVRPATGTPAENFQDDKENSSVAKDHPSAEADANFGSEDGARRLARWRGSYRG